MAKQKIKSIKNASDLESIKPLDEVEVAYSCPLESYPAGSCIDSLSYTKKGVFGGSFNIKDNNYIMISEVKKSDVFKTKSILTSFLYQVQNDGIFDNMHVYQGYCDGEDKSCLEAAIKNHISALNASKLREFDKSTK